MGFILVFKRNVVIDQWLCEAQEANIWEYADIGILLSNVLLFLVLRSPVQVFGDNAVFIVARPFSTEGALNHRAKPTGAAKSAQRTSGGSGEVRLRAGLEQRRSERNSDLSTIMYN